MRLYEYEAKELFQAYGIPVEKHVLLAEKADHNSLLFPCVVKAQTLTGKRGKAGGIQFASDLDDFIRKVAMIHAISVQGQRTDYIMISEKVDVKQELYLSFTIDASQRRIVCLFSMNGGVDIEANVHSDGHNNMALLDCINGFNKNEFITMVSKCDVGKAVADELADIAVKLYHLFLEKDMTLAEINPLALTTDGHLIAIDAKVTIDDNAIYRQNDLELLQRLAVDKTTAQVSAKCAGLEYVELDSDGTIGVIAGGAGIGMATVDTLRFYGGKPFNFLDLGGGVTCEKTCNAMKLLLDNPQIQGILINIFGGINNCADMAHGIEKAMQESGYPSLPVVVKSRGFSQEIGWEIYERLHFTQVKYGSTDDAAKLIISMLEAQV